MKGAIVFVVVFVLFIAVALVNIHLPLGNWVVQEYIPDVQQTDYEYLVEGVINGAIYGLIAWLIFDIANNLSKRSKSSKEKIVRAEKKPAAKTIPSSPNVEEIEGIGPAYAKKLSGSGIRTTDELLDMGSTKKGRRELARRTGISETIILEWVNMADLFRIKGIGEEYSELLREAGVNTVVQLATRNPKNLQKTLVGVNKTKKLVRRPPSLSQTEDWIEQAKILPRKVEY